jgi:hypothetical protein
LRICSVKLKNAALHGEREKESFATTDEKNRRQKNGARDRRCRVQLSQQF